MTKIKLDLRQPVYLADGTPVIAIASGSEIVVNLPAGTSARLGIGGSDTGRLFNAYGDHVFSRDGKLRLTNTGPLDVTQPLQTVDGKKVRYIGKLDNGQLLFGITYAGYTGHEATELRFADGRKSAVAGQTSGDDVIAKVVKKSVFLNVYADGTVGSTKHKTEESARHATKYGKVRVAILEQLFENDVQVGARINAAAANWYRDVNTSGRIATRADYGRA